MTYEEYQRDVIKDPAYLPPPPMPSPAPTFGQRMQDVGRGVARRIADAVTSTPPFPVPSGETTYKFLKNLTEGSPTTNPSFAPMPGAPRPSFAPMPNERPALQMPGLKDWWDRTSYQEPPNFRAMPTWNSGPEQTPYPRPPFLNFRNWMDTGERGPLPLQWYRPGGYPAPANRPMPEAYEARTSGGMLADVGRAAVRGVAGQPMAQMSGPYAPMQNMVNYAMLAEASKTDDQRALERMRPLLDENAQAALEPLMMRKYAERRGDTPTPSRWRQIWRSIVENYSQTEGGLTRGRPTPAPR